MTRNGKIARLPHAIQETLNHRLLDNEPGDTLLAWLNAQPAVQTVLAAQFQGVPISKQNLSEWRAGGFLAWQIRGEFFAQAEDLAGDSAHLAQIAAQNDGNSRLSDHLATVLAARYAQLLLHWDGEITPAFTQKLRALSNLTRSITALRQGDQTAARRKTSDGVGTACPPTPAAEPAPSPILHSSFCLPPSPVASDPVKPSQTTFSHSNSGQGPGVKSARPPIQHAPTTPILNSAFCILPSPQYLKPSLQPQISPNYPPQIIIPDLNDYLLPACPAATTFSHHP